MSVPIRFVKHEGHHLPLVDVSLKMSGAPGARIRERALLDTGSHVTLFNKDVLRMYRFPVHRGKESVDGLHGIGGPTPSFTLKGVSVALHDENGEVHQADIPELHFTTSEMITILGRDVLELFNAVIHIDFCVHRGFIEVG